MKRILLILTVFCLSKAVRAQYNTISGTVWRDNNYNSIRDAGEELISGIGVAMLDSVTNVVVSAAITDATGLFTLKNYIGTGTYYLNYTFPSAGFTVASSRIGSNNTLNSAADSSTVGTLDPDIVSTAYFTISSNTNLSNTYGLGLQRIPTTLTYWAAKPLTSTNWTQAFRLPKSNNAIGTLSKATILITDAAYHPSIGVENTGASSVNAQIDVSGRLTVTPPVGANLVVNTSSLHSQTLSASDGVTDFSGTSGQTWTNSYGYNWASRAITNGTQLNSFRTSAAPDSISLNGATTGASTLIGSANIFASVTTDVGAGVFVTYTYTAAVTLPVKLISFSAVKEGNTSLIRWIAASPNQHNFAVERSADGRVFTQLGYITGNENGSLTSGYSFTDAAPLAGKNLYRLKMIENGGAPTYSVVASINFASPGTLIAAYPNPAARSLTVENMTIGDHLTIRSITGQVMTSTTVTTSKQILDISALPAGSYLLQLHSADGSANSVRFVKQ